MILRNIQIKENYDNVGLMRMGNRNGMKVREYDKMEHGDDLSYVCTRSR